MNINELILLIRYLSYNILIYIQLRQHLNARKYYPFAVATYIESELIENVAFVIQPLVIHLHAPTYVCCARFARCSVEARS